MFTGSTARKWIRRTAVVGAVALAAVTGAAVPAQAYTQEVLGNWNSPAYLMFLKNSSSPLNSTFAAYLSVNGTAYRIVMRAGSGNGNTNECVRNAGWLPNGVYSNIDSDSTSYVKHYNKTWGVPVVQGWVWELGQKKCTNGTARTELFVHSQGRSGWNNSNYASAGCVKINQVDRAHVSSMYRSAYQTNRAELSVF
jgi:hypothetical protein